MQLIIKNDGTVRCVYSDELDLYRLGRLAIRRGSHVEPSSDGFWLADMSPVDGPVLGPFRTRHDALAAEQTWLENTWLNTAI